MLELTLRIGFSLLVVCGLMWGLARLVKRPLLGRSTGAMAVLTRAQLGRSTSVAVVRVMDRALVLGVTEGQVTLLAETDLADLERRLAGPDTTIRQAVALNTGSALSPATWRQTVDFIRERTARR